MPRIHARWLEAPPNGTLPLAPLIGALVSLVLGLFFVFVWTPHPWGWYGIDQYHELGKALARGESFPTTDVPWGYAYFVAAFYAMFGERAWIPVTAQAIANAAMPVMLYYLVQPATSPRIAAIAALLVGIFSFNTVYASTQSSDAICTLLFIGSLLAFARGHRTGSFIAFALSGLLSGIVPQFRPNMILFPVLLATLYVVLDRTRRAVAAMLLFLALVGAALAPWIVRNYWLTGAILPTSTHGGVQLWYGTLQVGPYIESRAYNPRSAFEPASFDYTSMAGQSLVVTAEQTRCEGGDDTTIDLVYHTDRNPQPTRVSARADASNLLTFELPGQPSPTTVYYSFESQWTDASSTRRVRHGTPPGPQAAPFVFFVDDEHLGDLDRHSDLLDVFDLIRLMRHVAWDERDGRAAPDVNHDGRIDEDDLKRLVVYLLGDGASAERVFGARPLAVTAERATLQLADDSTFAVPRGFSGVVTDVDVTDGLTRSLIPARRPAGQTTAAPTADQCHLPWDIKVNDVFYRKEPHLMRRYMALALDNISRDPRAFLAASAYRMGRLFVVRGSEDAKTTQQFAGSRFVYVAGLVLSATYLALFLTGVIVAWRTRSRLLMFLVPIAYVPLTICFVLTNMRYTITVQPLMFAFVALAIGAVGSNVGRSVFSQRSLNRLVATGAGRDTGTRRESPRYSHRISANSRTSPRK